MPPFLPFAPVGEASMKVHVSATSMRSADRLTRAGSQVNEPSIASFLQIGHKCSMAPPRYDALTHATRLFRAGKIAEAARHCSKVLRENPQSLGALSLLGVIRERQGDWAQAVILFRKALAIDPRSPPVLINLGIALLMSGSAAEAAGVLEKAVVRDPRQAMAHRALGAAFQRLGRGQEAADSFRNALSLHPNAADLHLDLGATLLSLRQAQAAIESLWQAVAINPNLVEAHRTLGLAFRDIGRNEAALESFEAALRINSRDIATLNSLGNLHKREGRYDAAIAAYDKILELDQSDANALSMAVFVRRQICDWARLDQLERSLIEHVHNDTAAILPFPFLAVSDDPEEQLRCARQFWIRRASSSASARFAPQNRDKLRIAYLSSDFHDHATARLMAQLFEEHDRSQFDILAFSYGPHDASPMRDRLLGAFNEFIDIRSVSDADAAQMILDKGVDILIDLKGHTDDARLGILSYRPAPVQAHYIGHPGTLGTDCVDYLIADPIVVPTENERYFVEQIVYLPHSYQVNDRKREITTFDIIRGHYGLPENRFVFCNFNNSYKISPMVLDVWVNIIKETPDSVLWLLSDNHQAEQNLRFEAQRRGISAERLVFAPRVPVPEHLGRHALADLFLDTWPYGAHTTGSDALWAGLPLVTFRGRSFASRVCASLLEAVGLSELIATDLEGYSQLAIELAATPLRLKQIRATLCERRDIAPLFDPGSTCRSLEEAYRQMWRIRCSGEAPRAIRLT